MGLGPSEIFRFLACAAIAAVCACSAAPVSQRPPAPEHVPELMVAASPPEPAWPVDLDLGHRDTIETVALAPDGASVASASRDWELKVWDVAKPGLRWSLHAPGQLGELRWVDAATLVAITHTSAVIWDGATGRERARFLGNEHTASAPRGSFAFDRTGALLAFTRDAEHGVIAILDVGTGREVSTIATKVARPVRIELLDGGRALGVWDRSNAIAVWDVATKRLVSRCSKCAERIASDHAFAREGTGFVDVMDLGGRSLHQIAGWRLPSPAREARVQGPAHILFSPDGSRAAVSVETYPAPQAESNLVIMGVRLFDTTEWKIVGDRTLSYVGASMTPRFSKDSSTLLVEDVTHRTLEIVDAESGASRGVIPAREASAMDSARGVVAEAHGSDLVIRTALGDTIARFDGREHARLEHVAFSADGSELTLARDRSAYDASCISLDLRTGEPRRSACLAHPPPRSSGDPVTCASRDGKWSAAGMRDLVEVREAGEIAARPVTVAGRVNALAISNDGSRLAVSDDAGLEVFDLARHEEPAVVGERLNPIAFGSTGDVVVGAIPASPGVVLVDVATRTVAVLPLSMNVINDVELITGAIAAAATPDRVLHPEALSHALQLTGDEPVAFSVSPDLAFVARAKESIEIERVRDGAILRVVAYELGGPVDFVLDDRGRFDCDAATLARLATGTETLGARSPGLLADFLTGR